MSKSLKNHLMIDIETMSNIPGGVIVSIGAAFFDPFDDYTEDFPDDIPLFYKNVDIDSCLKYGLSINGGTIFFWMDQGKEAREALTDPKPEKIDRVINDFNRWYWNQRDTIGKQNEIYVWSHGATFDLPFMTAAASKIGKKMPWKYQNARDTRTLFDLAFKGGKATFEGFGTKHNALHDSLTQVIWVQEAYKNLGVQKSG